MAIESKRMSERKVQQAWGKFELNIKCLGVNLK